MKLEDMKKSVSQMSTEELLQLTKEIRNNRRKVVREVKRKRKREHVKGNVSREAAIELLKQLGIELEGENDA